MVTMTVDNIGGFRTSGNLDAKTKYNVITNLFENEKFNLTDPKVLKEAFKSLEQKTEFPYADVSTVRFQTNIANGRQSPSNGIA